MYELLLLHWDTIQKIILNTLVVSIPEELFLLMFTLILMGEFDYWEEEECKKLINRWDYSRILIPTMIMALLSNILRYSGVEFPMLSVLPLIVFYILIVLTNDVLRDANALEWMGRALVFLILAVITEGISEVIYAPFVVYSMNTTMKEINQNILMNFLVSFPSRVIQYAVLLYLITKKRTLLRGNIMPYIGRNPFLAVLTVMVVSMDMVFLFSVYNAIVCDKILINVSYIMQVITITSVIIFPVINISALIGGIYYVKNREMTHKKSAYDQLENLLEEIKAYSHHENYGGINSFKWKLNEIEKKISQVAEALYEER